MQGTPPTDFLSNNCYVAVDTIALVIWNEMGPNGLLRHNVSTIGSVQLFKAG